MLPDPPPSNNLPCPTTPQRENPTGVAGRPLFERCCYKLETRVGGRQRSERAAVRHPADAARLSSYRLAAPAALEGTRAYCCTCSRRRLMVLRTVREEEVLRV